MDDVFPIASSRNYLIPIIQNEIEKQKKGEQDKVRGEEK